MDTADTSNLIQKLGLIGGVLMPVFNLPLILKIWRRKSADDISLVWLFGVWSCMLLMFPSSYVSDDPILKGYGFSNIVFFTAVVIVVMIYRKR